ncbi:GNAT family N-acetyltransferase [Streptomyces cyanogenus]|uniref:Acetyltransferase (GNAT) family protein n=1 Tax=Streptomyces cyanogenus TaxID=80860 RepID=A0ABX7U061_STRCY|nr:GNAT family N-acetyltransferase [Streptomyces cyanogenus]QTE02411.1 Acetyltransferase (GNAT) family protein [Streptomyces cyanogenus]
MDIQVQSFAVANLRRRPVVVETGGFVAGLTPGTDNPYLNYATPLPGAEPTEHDVAELIGVFRDRGLLPRLEFAPQAAPGVAPVLRAAGFATEAVHEYLVCTPRTLVPRSAGSPRVESPATDRDYAELDTALAEAFGGVFAPSAEGAARLRRTQENGGAVRFVRAPQGGIAGGASCSPPAEGTAELAGVGTRPAHRGRGVAAAVTAALTEAMFAQGAGSVWLEYSGEGSRRVYERTGYRPQGTRLYVSLPPAQQP